MLVVYLYQITIKTNIMKNTMQILIEKREKIAYNLRYAHRQGWATEIHEKNFADIKNEIKAQANQNNFEAEYYAY